MSATMGSTDLDASLRSSGTRIRFAISLFLPFHRPFRGRGPGQGFRQIPVNFARISSDPGLLYRGGGERQWKQSWLGCSCSRCFSGPSLRALSSTGGWTAPISSPPTSARRCASRLGGDSMVSVQVEPAGLWSPGRVLLVAPGGYQDLIEKVWSVVALRVPAGYELVVRASTPSPLAAPVRGSALPSRVAPGACSAGSFGRPSRALSDWRSPMLTPRTSATTLARCAGTWARATLTE